MRDNKKIIPTLIAQKGSLGGMNWLIDRNLTIGRDENCDIVIQDRQVSRFHAEIRIGNDDQFFLFDLGSKNGTRVNGRIINKGVELNDGDEIKIALAQEFLFVGSDATLPIENIVDDELPLNKKLFVEKNARRVWVGEEEIAPPLSVMQFNLLLLLYENENKVVSRNEIIRNVWSEEEAAGISDQAIDALVRRLRARLTKLDNSHDYIRTVRGFGFTFENQEYE